MIWLDHGLKCRLHVVVLMLLQQENVPSGGREQ